MSKKGAAVRIILAMLLTVLTITLVLGVGSVIGTVVLIVGVGWIFLSLIKLLSKKFNVSNHLAYKLNLGVTSVLLAWLIAELILRYGIATYSNYSEKNGGLFYISPYLVKESSWSSVWRSGEHVYKPNYKAFFNFKEHSYQLVTNSDGFRDKEYNSEHGLEKYIVFVLGDSFTEGKGVAMDLSWPQLLAKELSAAELQRKCYVINAGISGSDPIFELSLLEKSVEKYNPDIVIVAINKSDIDDIIVRGGLDRYDMDGVLNYADSPWWIGFYANSFLVRHFAHDVLDYNWLLIKENEMEQREKKAMDQMLLTLEKFESFANSKQFELLFVFHPTLEEMQGGRLELEPMITKMKASSNSLILNLLDYFNEHKQQNSPEDFYWPIDRHHNEKGYRLFAKGVKNYMISSDLIN